MYVFCDASEHAIAARAYDKVTDEMGNGQLGFILGEVTVSPTHGITIHRLKLCVALLAAEIAETIPSRYPL